jgi:phosphoribosylformylglycinamidine synthase
VLGREDGAPPPVDLAAERRNGDFVRTMIASGRVSACHDLSDGGLLVALAEMAMPSGIGVTLALPAGVPVHGFLFGEDQARYLLATGQPGEVLAAAAKAGVPALRLGETGGDALTLKGDSAISVMELRRINEAWLPAYMAGG